MSGRSLSEKSTPAPALAVSTRATRSSSSLRGESVGRYLLHPHPQPACLHCSLKFAGPAAPMTAACRPRRSALWPKNRAGVQTLLLVLHRPYPLSIPSSPSLCPPFSAQASLQLALLRPRLQAAPLCDQQRSLVPPRDLSKNLRIVRMLLRSKLRSFSLQVVLQSLSP